MDIHFLISNFSYIAIFLLMLTNGIVNFPSSQLLYVVCGYFVATTPLLLVPTIIVGATANTIGNGIIFLLIKKYEKPLAKKILLLDDATFTKIHTALHEIFSRHGMLWIFAGKLIPSVKAFIPIVAGLAQTKTLQTISIFFMSSLIWATLLTSVGFYFGEHATFTSISTVSFLIAMVVIFFIYKKYKYLFLK